MIGRAGSTTAQCFRSAERVEMLAQELYAALAEAFADRPALRDLFRRLSAEEAQHALRIRLLEKHGGKAAWAPEELGTLCDDLRAMAEEVASMKAEFGRPGGPPPADVVLRRVSGMERTFGALHAEELARSAEPEVRALFESLARQDAAHLALLRRELGPAVPADA
jgi:rubrerythrin